MNFISAYGILIIAICCSQWYFTIPSKRSYKFTSCHIINSYGIVARYHLGTLAFGSLLIALIQVS